ncbi:hypothetical protein SCOCK_280101 [Actinacidiphila cocklensis]|uniref:Uncharacterized protein n=1 Tax=Actinacidiphila cocklensis TaxID=887465 RepID=A0A9W4DR04_9ACTN|nr:hypothetical protein SCOCK_280101 [Actinacidiphila cocklensis]
MVVAMSLSPAVRRRKADHRRALACGTGTSATRSTGPGQRSNAAGPPGLILGEHGQRTAKDRSTARGGGPGGPRLRRRAGRTAGRGGTGGAGVNTP